MVASGSRGPERAFQTMRLKRVVTADLMGDPLPGRFERAEALRRSLPEPRPDIPLEDWLGERKIEERGLP